MESQVSRLLEEFGLQPIENNIFDCFSLESECRFQYNDDGFVLWNFRLSNLTSFLQVVNKFNNSIKFDQEIKENDTYIFLNVHIITFSAKVIDT